MDAKSMLGIVAALIIAGVSGGLAIYRDVGVMRADMKTLGELHVTDVSALRKDLDLRDLRERGMRDSLIRLEERHAASVARCAP